MIAHIRMFFTVFLSAAFVMGLVGCGSSVTRSVHVSGAALEPGTLAAIDVENRRGSVRVEVVPGLARPVVRAHFADTGKDEPVEDSWLGQDGVWIGANVEERSHHRVLRVLTRRGSEVDPNLHIDLTIQVPECNGVFIRNSGGPVVLVGVGGAIEVDNGFAGGRGGDVEIRSNRVLTEPVKVATPEGNIAFQTAGQTAGQLDISSKGGSITVKARSGRMRASVIDTETWSGQLNGGENPISLRTGKGSVFVLVSNRAESFRAAAF